MSCHLPLGPEKRLLSILFTSMDIGLPKTQIIPWKRSLILLVSPSSKLQGKLPERKMQQYSNVKINTWCNYLGIYETRTSREFEKPPSIKNQVVPRAAEGAKLGLLLHCGQGTDPVVSKVAKLLTGTSRSWTFIMPLSLPPSCGFSFIIQ